MRWTECSEYRLQPALQHRGHLSSKYCKRVAKTVGVVILLSNLGLRTGAPPYATEICWMIVLDTQGGCRGLRDSNVLLNGSCAGSYGPNNVSTEHDGNAATEDYDLSGITFLNAEERLALLREPR